MGLSHEYQSLFAPGFHDLTLVEVESHCVNAFPESARRKQVFDRFNDFLSFLNAVSVRFEIWIDGSFTSGKESPNDIDIVVFYDKENINQLGEQDKATLKYLFGDQRATNLRFLTDAYFVPGSDGRLRSYWRGWYGFTRDERAKGIVRLKYETP
jgi:hypothetical protein